MYPMGDQFKINLEDAKANDTSILKGNTYRISVLTERLLRLEYSPTGVFYDNPTMLVEKRNFNTPKFTVKQDDQYLELSTDYYTLYYTKERAFAANKSNPMKNFKIVLKNTPEGVEKVWYVNHPEVRNFKGSYDSFDVNFKDTSSKGLYSQDGFASIMDTSMLFQEDGTLSSRSDSYMDIYVFMYNNDFSLALKDYFYLTGYPSILPRYAFGNWWCRNMPYDEEKISNLLAHFEKDNVPFSVIMLDKDWHVRNVGDLKNLKSGFTFNPELFPDPKKVIDLIHSKNIHVGLQVDVGDGIYPHESNYPMATKYLDIVDNKIIQFDPFNPKFLDIYMKIFLHPLESLGVDFFWNDYDKPNNYALFFLNHYHYLDLGRTPTRRPMLFSRSAKIAPHRYGVLYSGKTEVSWKTLKTLPFFTSSASNLGINYWSHDIAGNHGGIEESELYIRSVELGVFSPILRFHAARGKYYKKEPWLWDIKTSTIVENYLRLRHKLIPYLYTEGYLYSTEGKLLVEPFYYKYPDTYDDEDYRNQYFLGREMLVCPILTKKDPVMNRTIQRFFMPEGIWYDFKTGKKFPGNKKYVSFFKEEDYPVFARAGSIIPLSNKSDLNNIGNPQEIEIHIFPGVNNTYTLYEDDGVTALYKEGYYLKTEIDYNYLKNNYTVIIRSVAGKSGMVPDRRDYKIRFRNTKKAEDVDIHFDYQEVPFESYLEDNDFVVYVKNLPSVGQVTINCKGNDIEIDALRLINEDINDILMELQIDTYLKEKIADIIFGTLPIKNKRIEIRKLRSHGLDREDMKLFLKLLEYIEQI